jgi:hypothetical protein
VITKPTKPIRRVIMSKKEFALTIAKELCIGNKLYISEDTPAEDIVKAAEIFANFLKDAPIKIN